MSWQLLVCSGSIAHNGFGLYARWRFKALTFNIALMMIEAQMFNLLLHRHWRKTRVMGYPFLFLNSLNSKYDTTN